MDWDDYFERFWRLVIPTALICAVIGGVIGAFTIRDILTPAFMGLGLGTILGYVIKLFITLTGNSDFFYDMTLEDFAEDHPFIYSVIIAFIPFVLTTITFVLVVESDISMFVALLINVVALLCSCGFAQLVGYKTGYTIRYKFRRADGLREYLSVFGEIFDRGTFAWLLHIVINIGMTFIAYTSDVPEAIFLPMVFAGLRFGGKVLLGIMRIINYIYEEYFL